MYACAECHGADANTYVDATLDLRHWIDATPGWSEVLFTAGIAPRAVWNGTTCTNVACHGNGRTGGTIADGHRTFDCNDCHADRSSGGDAWERMSGEHKKHLEAGAACADCHASVVSSTQVIVGPAWHVDGLNQVVMAPGIVITRNANGTCSGRCHGSGTQHSNEGW